MLQVTLTCDRETAGDYYRMLKQTLRNYVFEKRLTEKIAFRALQNDPRQLASLVSYTSKTYNYQNVKVEI